jgi:hypothetical protein
MTQIAAETLDLLGATIGVAGQHRLGSFFSKVLTGLAKRLGHTRHCPGDVLFDHVQAGRNLICGLIHQRFALASGLVSWRHRRVLNRARDPTCRLLDFVDNSTRHVVRSISCSRHRITRLVS